MATDDRQSRTRRRRVAAALTGGLLAAWAAPADVLVLSDGARVATLGAWELRDATVVFHDERGRLRSVQLAQVDLEASRRETAREATRQATRRRHLEAPAGNPAPAASRRPVRSITDADVAHVTAEDATEGEGNDDGTQDDPSAAVVVTEWSQHGDPGTGGVTLRGSVRNTSEDTVGSLQVLIELYDAEGEQLASTTAAVQPPALTPRARGRFQVRVPGIPDFDDARFHVDSVALVTHEPQPAVVPQRRPPPAPSAKSPDETRSGRDEPGRHGHGRYFG